MGAGTACKSSDGTILLHLRVWFRLTTPSDQFEGPSNVANRLRYSVRTVTLFVCGIFRIDGFAMVSHDSNSSVRFLLHSNYPIRNQSCTTIAFQEFRGRYEIARVVFGV